MELIFRCFYYKIRDVFEDKLRCKPIMEDCEDGNYFYRKYIGILSGHTIRVRKTEVIR
jgi:hypothetical protein